MKFKVGFKTEDSTYEAYENMYTNCLCVFTIFFENENKRSYLRKNNVNKKQKDI
jgi:hypothetical protein